MDRLKELAIVLISAGVAGALGHISKDPFYIGLSFAFGLSLGILMVRFRRAELKSKDLDIE